MLFEELGLPLPIKRLAWERDFSLFVKVIIPHAEKYMASEITPRMIVASQQVQWKPLRLFGPAIAQDDAKAVKHECC